MTGIEPLLVPIGIWAWESYGKDAVGWIVKRLAKGAEDVKAAGWERVEWARASHNYRQEMQRLYGSMQIFGMNRPVPLTDIFTDTYLLDKPIAWRRHAIEKLRAHAQAQPDQMSTEKRHNGVDLVQTNSRLFILGQPGAGKTTFLKYLVSQAITGNLEAIPIFVSLKAWADAKIDLLPFLVRQFAICGFPDAQPFVERILEEGKALVLFDGLDEVNLEADARQRITTAIRECTQQYGPSRMVITCRTAATEYVFEQFSYCELADFTQEQIEAFVARWFHEDEAKRDAFLKALEHDDNKGLRDLSRRPLLLTMLCLTFEETMAFPRRRAELYEEAIDALLKKWDSSRSIQRDTIYRKLSLGYKRQLLMELAAETFERGEFFMPKRDVVERAARFLRRLPPVDVTKDIDGEPVLRAIEAQHGLLIERARDIYSFSHLTFHEYFAARYIADHPEEGVLQSVIAHAADPQWREVLLLTASMLDYRNIASLFHVWDRALQEKVQGDTDLRSLIVLSAETAHAIAPSSIGARATVLMTALIDQVNIGIEQLISQLDRAHALASADDHNLAEARANTLARTLDRDLDRAHDLARDFDLARAEARALASADDHNLAEAHAHDLAHALDLARTHAESHAHDLARSHDLARTHAEAHAYDLARTHDLIRALAEAHDLARTHASTLNCVIMLARVRDVGVRGAPSLQIREDDILGRGKNGQLTSEQIEQLNEYVNSTYRLLECLDVATVEDRTAILDQLLILPSQSTGTPRPSDTTDQRKTLPPHRKRK